MSTNELIFEVMVMEIDILEKVVDIIFSEVEIE